MSLGEETLALQIRAMKLPAPEREFRFAPPRRWRFDFAWPDLKLALEVDGAIWTNGRHSRGQGYIADCEKFSEAVLLGWRVLRMPSDWVKDGTALGYLKRALGVK